MTVLICTLCPSFEVRAEYATVRDADWGPAA